MKKAKVVIKQTAKQKRLMVGKKAALLAVGLVAALGAVSVVVPTSNIPGFKYIASLIGLNEDATRNLTMLDFASYAVGTKDNKIKELRASNLSYNGAGNNGGGLSPFATLSADRLAEAYAKNAQEAREMEKSLGGKIAPFDRNILDKDIAFDPSLLAKGFDPSKISATSQAARSGAMEALAAAAGLQAEAFGRPVKKEDLQQVANLVGLKDANISNIVGAGNILGLANKDDMLYSRITKDAKALMGTSIFGSVNPDFTRTDTRIGRPVFGLFKDLGTAFFFSRYAASAKLPTAASDIAVAAFGGSPQDQSIITKEEDPSAPTISVNPEQELSVGAHNVNQCAEVSQTYSEIIASTAKAIESYIKVMQKLPQIEGANHNSTGVPGCCLPEFSANNETLSARNKWNYYVFGYSGGHMTGGAPQIDKSLKELCIDLTNARRQFNDVCGITFEEPEYDCNEMARQLRLASCGYAMSSLSESGICVNLSIFANSDFNDDNINRQKYREYREKYNEYMQDTEAGYTPKEASRLAALDVGFTKDDIAGPAYAICDDPPSCTDHINYVLEKTFKIKNILDIRLAIMEQYGENSPQLQNYDARQISICQQSGDMSACQDILDYYKDGVWEQKCSNVNLNLYKYIDPNTNNLRPNWTISKIREKEGPIVADCIVIYLSM